MTVIEKTDIANFLDLAGDYLSGGFRRPHAEYIFTDTAETAAETAAETIPENSCINNRAGLLKELAREIACCRNCGLCNTRTNTVTGEGVLSPLVMVIGEGPGEDEDATGQPFVGRAGQLLDRMLDSRGKIGLSRTTNCYIANILKCRPPGNRNPEQNEISACVPFLVRQIQILEPKIILAAGNTAAKTLLDSTEGITRLRGAFTVFKGTFLMNGNFNIPLLPTFHPSALLRDESLKGPVWEDMKTLRNKLCVLDIDYAKRMADIPL